MKIALGVSYQGTVYHGWQAQAGLRTVQSTLEEAVAKVADQTVSLVCAGRTDKGVHALGQVVHFDATAKRSQSAWLLGINSYLPEDIRIDWVQQELADHFHARFSAVARRYCYVIYNRPLASALWNEHTTHCYWPLNETRMQGAANYLVGEHDFSAFRAVDCQSNSAVRYIHELKVTRYQDYIVIDVKANAFLHHMVRNIVGLLMIIGSGKQEMIWAKEVLLLKDRSKAAVTMKPNGLYLLEVFYPESFAVPKIKNPFLWWLYGD